MSLLDNITKSNKTQEELQIFLHEKLDALGQRVKYKNEISKKMVNVLNEKQLQYFNECGNFIQTNTNGEIIHGNFCKNRLCPVCNRRYAAQKWHKVKNIADNIKRAISPTWAFLTLTVKNVPAENLSNEITHLMQSIDRLHKTSLWKNQVLGFFRSLEVTYNVKLKTYHPHYHYILCLQSDYIENVISTYEWRKTWERSARLNYNSQVDIRLINDNDDLSGGIAEVAKYAVKISTVADSGENAIKPLTNALKHRRLISFGGIINDYAKQYDITNKRELKKRDKIPENTYKYENGHYNEWKGVE